MNNLCKRVDSCDQLLFAGVATYNLKLLKAGKDFDFADVPIDLSSRICGVLLVRNVLNLITKIFRIFTAHARTYVESLSLSNPVESPFRTKSADIMSSLFLDLLLWT